MSAIEFLLNGKAVSYPGDAGDRLLDALRSEYHCTSVKCGCREGECGACSVLLDGLLVNSCCIAMGSVYGSSVTTLEGYRKTQRFAVLDRAFAAVSAVQCGFCTPGMIMAAESILSSDPHPDEEKIRIGLSGNICRCTGYNAVVEAILDASEKGDGLW